MKSETAEVQNNMKAFVYKGKFNGDESSLPTREHPEGAVPFKEADDMKKLSFVMNIASMILTVFLYAIVVLRAGRFFIDFTGAVLSLVFMVPHEFLHGICFKGTVYMYQNLAQGMLFVLSTEEISKARFVFLSLLPNIVFGLIPFVVFMINPNLTILGTLGAISIPMGAGDYYNVFNAVTQMPKGALTYLSGMHSYWYLPESSPNRHI